MLGLFSVELRQKLRCKNCLEMTLRHVPEGMTFPSINRVLISRFSFYLFLSNVNVNSNTKIIEWNAKSTCVI